MIRLLAHDEYYKLIHPFQQLFGQDKLPPLPEIAPFCAVEEEEGHIKGFLFLQTAFHLEPFGSLGGVSFSDLRKVIDNALTSISDVVYYLHSDNSIGQSIFESKGFRPIGMLLQSRPGVYIKDF